MTTSTDYPYPNRGGFPPSPFRDNKLDELRKEYLHPRCPDCATEFVFHTCRLHEAAPALYEALQEIYRILGPNGNPRSASAVAEHALALVRGGEGETQ